MANSEAYLNGRQKIVVVPEPLVHRSPPLETAGPLFAEPSSSTQLSRLVSSSFENSVGFEALPVMLYECNAAHEVTYVSENISELFGLEANELIGNRLLSEQRMPAEDLALISDRLGKLEHLNKRTSLIHRMLNRRGLPVWVAHSLWKTGKSDTIVVRGCIVPMDYSGQLLTSEQAFISRFVHKIGNHFQLLNLVVNSLKRTVPESRETLMLQETVERAIELTRGFSDYNQVPTCLSRIEVLEIFQATVMTRRSSFEKKGVSFSSQIHPSVNGAIIQADPYLLELAIGHVLQNALEATEPGGEVTIQARVKCCSGIASVASISVIDFGCGIEQSALGSALIPFFTSKKNHDGLGLSMASRFVELHGGILRIVSVEGKGTEVEIVLPIEVEGQPLP